MSHKLLIALLLLNAAQGVLLYFQHRKFVRLTSWRKP